MYTRSHTRIRGCRRRKQGLPFRSSLFWDADPGTIDPRRHARYIIERILDLGDEHEVRWVAHHYSLRLIRDTIARSRVLHEKSRSLWRRVFA
ncbi:MAG TPA: hypothetical protein DCM87_05060 [Planctomycetes bacterium]|jgi:hypothetical protein|nr:hypothetical protein [Planctomycetota bacterium]